MTGTDQAPVLIVGGTGQVGAAVADQLRGRGVPIRIAGRRSEVVLDHDDPATYEPALAGVRQMFVALPDRPDAAEIERRLYAAASSVGVEQVVKLSAASAGWDPPVSFGVAHRAGEAALRATSMRWTILRPNVFQETIAMFCDDVSKGRMIVPRCTAPVAFVAVNDVAEVAATALTDDTLDHRILTLTGPVALRFDEVAHMVAEHLGRSVRHRAMPRPIARRILPLVAGMPRWRAGQIVDLFAGLDQGGQAKVSGDVAAALGRSGSPLEVRLPHILEGVGAAPH